MIRHDRRYMSATHEETTTRHESVSIGKRLDEGLVVDQAAPPSRGLPLRLRALPRQGVIVPVAIIVVAALLHFVTLLQAPEPFIDEGWNAARSWGLLQTGRAFGTLDAGAYQEYPGYWVYFPWLGTAIHAPFMFLFEPTLFAMRFACFLFGLVLQSL